MLAGLVMFGGLEWSKAFHRVPRPPERLAHFSRPDLDAIASRLIVDRYHDSLDDERAEYALIMKRRHMQRALMAKQSAELYSLGASVRTPYQAALERKTREAARSARAAAAQVPHFADTVQIEQALVHAMASARGARNRSGAHSSHVSGRHLREGLPRDDSRLLHPPAYGEPPSNALAVARENERLAGLRTGAGIQPLGLGQLHNLIGHMLEEKVEADRVDDALRNPRQGLAEFVADELWRRYGLRQLAYRHLVNFAQSAISMAAHSERVRTFAAAMGWLPGEEEWPAPKLHFYCALLPLLFEPTAIREKLAPTGPVWLPMAQLVQAVRKMFYSRALEVCALRCPSLRTATPCRSAARAWCGTAWLRRARSACLCACRRAFWLSSSSSARPSRRQGITARAGESRLTMRWACCCAASSRSGTRSSRSCTGRPTRMTSFIPSRERRGTADRLEATNNSLLYRIQLSSHVSDTVTSRDGDSDWRVRREWRGLGESVVLTGPGGSGELFYVYIDSSHQSPSVRHQCEWRPSHEWATHPSIRVSIIQYN